MLEALLVETEAEAGRRFNSGLGGSDIYDIYYVYLSLTNEMY